MLFASNRISSMVESDEADIMTLNRITNFVESCAYSLLNRGC
ncbi:hypothetical protein VIBNISFn27_1080028 [Vibrio nigripulchritudo SFn27]|nr:hypothetical protein VIBNIBLFn1_760030 [Vibrio nigripulchritudo BLFn1]CCN86484.1 hypothetical protein VIBNISFn27_1080028 [Vibrio nigripulchritudo SFn27]CCN97027.1 hypothetical protein VIBNIENn2_870030 [Vibrio nigripulchritudo ENn2]